METLCLIFSIIFRKISELFFIILKIILKKNKQILLSDTTSPTLIKNTNKSLSSIYIET